jgi:16S rRNA (adenine1518-N6/adenine1519-N6)-dimethyltransferase
VNYNSPSEIRNILKENHLSLKKRWGQNFIINRNIRERIIRLIRPGKNELIWEIGPGLGAFTESLLGSGAHVIGFEIDHGLVAYLKMVFAHHSQLKLVEGDIVKTWERSLKEYGMPTKVYGNLPYASASAIILSFILKDFSPHLLFITIQRELAERMGARPGTKDYSSFSVLFQYAFVIKDRFHLKPASFYPLPAVMSTFLCAVPAKRTANHEQKHFFFTIVRCAFRSRRKTLINNLLSESSLQGFTKDTLTDILKEEGIPVKTRSEELSVEQCIHLAKRLFHERRNMRHLR